MAYATSAIGVNVTDVFTPWTSGAYQESTNNPPFAVGTRIVGNGNAEWVYVKANTAITGAGYFVVFDNSFGADMLSTSNDAGGLQGGSPMAAIAAGSYGWVQVKGVGSLRVLASAAANVALNSTATAGALDDDATTGAFVVQGVFLGTAQGASAGTNTTARFNYPQIAAAAL